MSNMTDPTTSNGIDPHHRTRSPRAGWVRALALAAALAAPGFAAAQPGACPRAGHTVVMQGELPRLLARLDQGRSLKIVAIGSSSTAGAGASSPANSYPDQLKADLIRRFPGHDIDVVNAGANGQEVPDMLARLDRDVLAHKPDLVIWQFGTNGLLRGRSLTEMESAARIGIERMQAAGAEVVLMDLQHAPRIDSSPARDDILAMMERLGRTTGTAVFHRYRLMKSWAASLGSSYSRMVHPDQLHMTDVSYHCMAAALAASLYDAGGRRALALHAGSSLAAAVRVPAHPARAASMP